MSAPAAQRMRRYRARKRLVRALEDARAKGVNVTLVYGQWQAARNAAPSDTDTRTIPMDLEDPTDYCSNGLSPPCAETDIERIISKNLQTSVFASGLA
jgi:hypothetical protein